LPAPVIVSSTPSSPNSSSTNPELFITGPANKTIQLFNNASGSGIPLTTVTTNGSGNASVIVNVPTNSTTLFSAKAIDGLGNVSALSNVFTFIHDNIAPSTPVIVNSTPQSPSNNSITPSILISGEAGSLIQLYKNGSCSGLVVGTGTIGVGGMVTIPTSVTANSSTIFSARALDAAGNAGVCSNTLTYVHDNIAPNVPLIVSSTPASPSNYITPILNIAGGEIGATLYIYNNGFGSGSPVATAIIGPSGTATVTVTVTAFSTSTYTARQMDLSGNFSLASSPFYYTHIP
jgi:hypothetical protein